MEQQPPIQQANKSSLATAGMVLGIVGICLSLIPVVNMVCYLLAILAVIFGIIVLVKKDKAGKGKAIAAVILGAVTLITVLIAQVFLAAIMFQAAKTAETAAPSTSTAATAPAEAKTTDAKWDLEAAYAKIQNGMTKAQVEEATGKKSTTCTESQIPGVGKTESCTYGNIITDKGSIMVIYSQDVVSSKTKSTM